MLTNIKKYRAAGTGSTQSLMGHSCKAYTENLGQ